MEEEIRRRLYGLVLYRLREKFGLEESELCEALRPSLVRLREAYSDSSVRVDYADDTVVGAYLLGYYPNYVLLSYSALAQVAPALRSDTLVTVICGGPLPEVVALGALMNQKHPRGSKLRLNYVDRSQLWAWASDSSVAVARRLTPAVRVTCTPAIADVSAPFDESVFSALAASDIYVFQNCLNELWPSQAVVNNIVSLSRGAKDGAFFAFIDQANYGVTYQAMVHLRDLFLQENFSLVEDCSADWMLNLRFFIPEAARTRFFDPGPPQKENGQWLGQYPRTMIDARSLIVRKNSGGNDR
jgi:hypothetical protein